MTVAVGTMSCQHLRQFILICLFYRTLYVHLLITWLYIPRSLFVNAFSRSFVFQVCYQFRKILFSHIVVDLSHRQCCRKRDATSCKESRRVLRAIRLEPLSLYILTKVKEALSAVEQVGFLCRGLFVGRTHRKDHRQSAGMVTWPWPGNTFNVKSCEI